MTEAATPNGEPQLLKSPAPAANGNGAAGGLALAATPPAPPDSAVAEVRSDPDLLFDRRSDELPRNSNGLIRNGSDRQAAPGANGVPPPPRPNPAPPLNGEPRRTLHLSLGGNGVNGHGLAPEPAGNGARNPAADRPSSPPAPAYPPAAAPQPQSSYPRPPAPPYPHNAAERSDPRPPAAQRYGYPPAAGDTGGRSEAARNKADPASFIDLELRARVEGDITAFLAAFDAALADDTQESRSALREATDRLLRAGARTRIELERLEARAPLPVRDAESRTEANWRHR